MNPRRTSNARLSINAVAVMVTMAFASVSCTANVDLSTSGTTTPSGSTDGTDTTSSAPDTTTRKRLSLSDLEDLLPAANDIGEDYTQDPAKEEDDGADDPFVAELEKSCPEYAALEQEDDADKDEVQRVFSTDDDRSMSVELSFARNATPNLDELEELLASIKKCDEVKFSEDGFDYKVELSAKRDDRFGDAAAALEMHITMTGDEIPKAIEFETTIYSAQVGGLALTVSATSGLTSKQAVIPADIDVLKDVMDLMVTRTEDAQ